MDVLDWALWAAVAAMVYAAGALAYAAGLHAGRKATKRETWERKTCPHGYEDWDQCPVCCH